LVKNLKKSGIKRDLKGFEAKSVFREDTTQQLHSIYALGT